MPAIQTRTTWLAQFLDTAVQQGMCTSIFCTTCGAREFRKGLQKRAESQASRRGTEADGLIPASNVELARQLKLLDPDEVQARQWLEPVRMIFTDLAGGLLFGRIPEEDLVEQLSGTWSGSVLEDMRRHHEATIKRHERHEREHAPETIEAKRAEKKRQKQEAHQARLAEKPEIDQRWFEKHPEELDKCLKIRRQRASKQAQQFSNGISESDD